MVMSKLFVSRAAALLNKTHDDERTQTRPYGCSDVFFFPFIFSFTESHNVRTRATSEKVSKKGYFFAF